MELEPKFFWMTKPSKEGIGLRVAEYPIETDEGREMYPHYFYLEEVDVNDEVVKSILIDDTEAVKLAQVLAKMGFWPRRRSNDGE